MDDLTRIKGIGKAAAKRLAGHGIETFASLANLAAFPNAAAELDVRAEWIEQATAMAIVAEAEADTQGNPPRPDEDGDGRAEAPAVPADGGLGGPHTDTPESEDRGGGGGDPAVPARDDAPEGSDDPRSEMGGGDGPVADVSTVPPVPESALVEEDTDAQLGILLRNFPLTLAAIRAFRAANPGINATAVRVTSKRDGFRRAGLAHAKAPTDHPAGRFSPEQIEQLLAEPNLTVELV
jgi:hypothetical protein